MECNACGLSCPAPVLLAKKSIEEEHPKNLTILVDNRASAENVSRFLNSQGYRVEEQQREEALFAIIGVRDGEEKTQQTAPINDEEKRTVVLISAATMGSGDDTLGAKLMANYIKTLKELGPELWHLIFINGGVYLTLEDSPVLAELQEYETEGTTILACGTCLEHFAVGSEKAVGVTTNMLDIVMACQLADKVITIS